MRLKARAILGSVLIASLAAASSEEAALRPDQWVHAGDGDGDGLTDDFETRYGLDPSKVSSYADGIPDESRQASATLTMWEAQKAEEEQLAIPASGGDGAGCGATGLEVFLLLVLLLRIRPVR